MDSQRSANYAPARIMAADVAPRSARAGGPSHVRWATIICETRLKRNIASSSPVSVAVSVLLCNNTAVTCILLLASACVPAGKSLDISAHLRVLGRLVRLRFEMSRPLFLVPAPHLAGWPLLWHAIRMSAHRGVGLEQDAHLLCNLSSELITGLGLLRGYGLSLRCPGIGFPMSFQCVAQTLSNLAFRC